MNTSGNPGFAHPDPKDVKPAKYHLPFFMLHWSGPPLSPYKNEEKKVTWIDCVIHENLFTRFSVKSTSLLRTHEIQLFSRNFCYAWLCEHWWILIFRKIKLEYASGFFLLITFNHFWNAKGRLDIFREIYFNLEIIANIFCEIKCKRAF